MPTRPSPTLTVGDASSYTRDLGLKSLSFFSSYHMEPVVPGPVPEFHLGMDGVFEGTGYVLVYWPRGDSKSSKATTIFPTWRKLNGEPFIVITGETDTQVKKLFEDTKRPILNETGEYANLHEDFGHELRVASHNDHEIVFVDGSAIRALSAGASTRGLKHNNQRPTLFVIDDLEERKAVQSKTQRDHTWDWFTRDLLPMKNPKRHRFVWVGTLLHEDASMQRAAKLGSFHVIKRKAIIREQPEHPELWAKFHAIWDEALRGGLNGEEQALEFYEKNRAAMDAGTEVLWPDRYPYGHLVAERRKMGPTAFGMEFQQEAVSAGNRIVDPESIIDFRIEETRDGVVLVDRLADGDGLRVPLSECVLWIAVDPAISQKDSADYFVCLALAAHPSGARFVLEVVRDRLTIRSQVETILQVYQGWKARANADSVMGIGIEDVAYQAALKQVLDDAGTAQGLTLPTVPLHPVKDKVLRLQRWAPAFERKEVRIQTHLHHALVEELTGFSRDGLTRPAHDDTVDGFTYAMELAETPGSSPMHYEGIRI